MTTVNKTNIQPPFKVIELASEALKQVCSNDDPQNKCYSVTDLDYRFYPGVNNAYSISFKNREGDDFKIYCQRFGNKYECSSGSRGPKISKAGCGASPTGSSGDDLWFEVDAGADAEYDAAGEEDLSAAEAKEDQQQNEDLDVKGSFKRPDARQPINISLVTRPDAMGTDEDVSTESTEDDGSSPEPVCQQIKEIVVTPKNADDVSWGVRVSGGGKYAVFFSKATNLIEGDDNQMADIFLADLQTGAMELVNSVDGGFDYSPADVVMSGCCNYGSGIPFVGEPKPDTYEGEIFTPAINFDGNAIAYSSRSKELGLPIVDSMSGSDIFLYNRLTGKTKMITIANDGKQPKSSCSEALNPEISDDGRVVVFTADADYTDDEACGIRAYAYDDLLGHMFLLTHTDESVWSWLPKSNCDVWFNPATEPRISGNGALATLAASTIFYAGDTMSSSQGGGNANGFIVGLADDYVTPINYNNDGGESSVKNNSGISLNFDGSLAGFDSSDPNILGANVVLNGKRQAFARDFSLNGGFNFLVSSNVDGEEANEDVRRSTLSANGKWVVFESKATNLLDDHDTYNKSQVYLKNIETGEVVLVSKAMDGNGGNKMSAFADLSDDGSVVVFESEATNLTKYDGYKRDVFAFFRDTGEVKKISQTLDFTEKTYEVCE